MPARTHVAGMTPRSPASRTSSRGLPLARPSERAGCRNRAALSDRRRKERRRREGPVRPGSRSCCWRRGRVREGPAHGPAIVEPHGRDRSRQCGRPRPTGLFPPPRKALPAGQIGASAPLHRLRPTPVWVRSAGFVHRHGGAGRDPEMHFVLIIAARRLLAPRVKPRSRLRPPGWPLVLRAATG